jgi:hypothetical protein
MNAGKKLTDANEITKVCGYIFNSSASDRPNAPSPIFTHCQLARDRKRRSYNLKPDGFDHDVSLLPLRGIQIDC